MTTITPAQPTDLNAILALLQSHNLPPEGVAEHLPHMWVARADDALLGCVGLEIYGRFALFRSLAVADSHRGQGLGQQLTQTAITAAQAQGITHLYLLTETAAHFFPKFDFHPTTRAEVPTAVKASVEFTSACPDSALVMVKTLKP